MKSLFQASNQIQFHNRHQISDTRREPFHVVYKMSKSLLGGPTLRSAEEPSTQNILQCIRRHQALTDTER